MAKSVSSVEKKIAEQFGDKVLIGAQSILDSERIVIPISPKLNFITSGGILEGSMVTFSGPPKAGKSLSSLYFAGIAQQPEYGGEFCPEGREVYYYNVEGRLRERDLLGIPNLNLDKFHIIQSTAGNILNAAEMLQIAHMLIDQKLGAIHIIDSYSALCTEAEMNSGMDEMQRADGPRLLAKFCRKISNTIPVNKSILIGITHIMGNPSGYGAATKEKGGFALQFHVDTKLKCKFFKPWMLNKEDAPIGQEVEWVCECTPLGPPWRTTTSYIRYGVGIDKYQELLTMCVDSAIIKRSGSWYTIGDQKFQGLENAHKAICNDVELYKLLSNTLYELTGIK